MKLILFLLLFVGLSCNLTWAEDGHEDHEHEENSFGIGQAITEVAGDGEKFKLSKSSQKLLGIKTANSNAKNIHQHEVPKSSLVRFQAHQGIFVLRDGWFQLLELEIDAEKSLNGWLVKSKELGSQENIVVSGVPMLRVAQLQASGQGGKGHAH